jgi:hypothetical protein
MGKKGYQRRHSALRTISGGICWGLTLRWTGSMQLLLLGYQQMVNNAGFKGNLFFFDLADITVYFSVNSTRSTTPSSYRPIRVLTFARCAKTAHCCLLIAG